MLNKNFFTHRPKIVHAINTLERDSGIGSSIQEKVGHHVGVIVSARAGHPISH